MTTEIIKFNVGQTYSNSFIGDSQLFAHFTILARTAKTITTKVDGKIVRRGLSLSYDNTTEQFAPFGRYSMAMIIGANKGDRR